MLRHTALNTAEPANVIRSTTCTGGVSGAIGGCGASNGLNDDRSDRGADVGLRRHRGKDCKERQRISSHHIFDRANNEFYECCNHLYVWDCNRPGEARYTRLQISLVRNLVSSLYNQG